MHSVNQLLNFYTSNLHIDFCKLAEPLKNCFHLDHFTYSLTTPEGFCFQITNNAAVGEFYFSNHLYKFNPFICHPNNYKHDQIIVTGDFPHKPFQMAQKIVDKRYGLDNFLIIYKKERGFTHVLMFSSTDKKIPLNTIFTNNKTVLSKFGDYFVKAWSNNLLKMECYMINMGTLIGPDYFKINTQLSLYDLKEQKVEFLKHIGLIENHHLPLKNFTQRELGCIDLFLKGKSAREIGEHLEISRRTVEHYLDNIKSKLGCFSKSELFERLYYYQNLDII